MIARLTVAVANPAAAAAIARAIGNPTGATHPIVRALCLDPPCAGPKDAQDGIQHHPDYTNRPPVAGGTAASCETYPSTPATLPRIGEVTSGPSFRPSEPFASESRN